MRNEHDTPSIEDAPCGANAVEPGMPASAAASPTKRKPLGVIRRFSRERRGSVAIEFGILALPFIALIFAILEASLSFSTQQLLANAVDRVSRDVRTGRLRDAQLRGNQLHGIICGRIQLVVARTCPDLVVDLQTYNTFAAVPKTIPMTAGGDLNSSGFRVTPGGPGTINQLRAYYRWPVITDLLRSSMSSLPGGKTLLGATATWRNEPFDL
ncbi:MAG: pilus assembly protein [Rhizobiaceae bacterium]|jgi:Flp pilus assembly protein TadG|nr:pilus assembly protein [Rhizobiaceae bacterium]